MHLAVLAYMRRLVYGPPNTYIYVLLYAYYALILPWPNGYQIYVQQFGQV